MSLIFLLHKSCNLKFEEVISSLYFGQPTQNDIHFPERMNYLYSIANFESEITLYLVNLHSLRNTGLKEYWSRNALLAKNIIYGHETFNLASNISSQMIFFVKKSI